MVVSRGAIAGSADVHMGRGPTGFDTHTCHKVRKQKNPRCDRLTINNRKSTVSIESHRIASIQSRDPDTPSQHPRSRDAALVLLLCSATPPTLERSRRSRILGRRTPTVLLSQRFQKGPPPSSSSLDPLKTQRASPGGQGAARLAASESARLVNLTNARISKTAKGDILTGLGPQARDGFLPSARRQGRDGGHSRAPTCKGLLAFATGRAFSAHPKHQQASNQAQRPIGATARAAGTPAAALLCATRGDEKTEARPRCSTREASKAFLCGVAKDCGPADPILP